MRVEITNTPPMVTNSMAMRKPQPVSPPMVPASRVRISDSQAASMKPMVSPPSPTGILKSEITAPATIMMTSERMPNQRISAPVPFENVLSTAYCSRSLNDGFSDMCILRMSGMIKNKTLPQEEMFESDINYTENQGYVENRNYEILSRYF
ncbi:hypothetical protein SDC9_94331 [bioreactor metagenome]|uniref:Uncharacterized protein n=1 Tax=bioreactor metagenome TaxID=1076179 RepID=A0A645A356_9ZZZZ